MEERYQPPGWVGFLLPVLREQLGKLPTRSAHQRLSLGRREPLLPEILQDLKHDVHVVVVIRVRHAKPLGFARVSSNLIVDATEGTGHCQRQRPVPLQFYPTAKGGKVSFRDM